MSTSKRIFPVIDSLGMVLSKDHADSCNKAIEKMINFQKGSCEYLTRGLNLSRPEINRVSNT